MVRALYFPKADRSTQWFNDTYRGADITPNVNVWHTTETGGWPGYGGGASAPHLTYYPQLRKWRQHFRLDRSSRALRNASGGVETNTLNAAQVEIIAYSDEGLAISRGHLPVSRLSLDNLRDLAEYAKFMWDEWGLRLEIDPGWLYTDFHAAPMSFSEWRNFYGHCGHNRVPENTHWDPAALDIKTIIEIAKGGSTVSIWDEDLTPGTPGNDITNLAHTIIPESWGRYAADLLGYSAASLAWVRNSKFSKPGYPDEDDQTLTWFVRMGYSHSRTTRDEVRKQLATIKRMEEKQDAILAAVQGQSAPEIMQRIDEHHAAFVESMEGWNTEVGKMLDLVELQSDTLDDILLILKAHASGSLDAEQVVSKIMAKFHKATAPTEASVVGEDSN